MVDLGIVPPVDPENKNYYLDKEQMRNALREHRDACLKAEAAGEELPRVSEYLGACFLRIARGLAMTHKFRRYSYIEDMIDNAVYMCLKNIRSCDPDKISEKTQQLISPLSYFTQVCYFEFLTKIKSEKKQSEIKWRLLLQSDVDSYTSNPDDADDFRLGLDDFIRTLGPQPVFEDKKKEVKQEDNPFDGFEE